MDINTMLGVVQYNLRTCVQDKVKFSRQRIALYFKSDNSMHFLVDCKYSSFDLSYAYDV